MPSNPLIALYGPTASGKSALAIELARRFRGEVLSADSRQVYAGMDIGTAKTGTRGHVPARHDESFSIDGIPHYFIDILAPNEPYSAAAFRDDAVPVITQLHATGHVPIVVGGTGFYLRTLLGETSHTHVAPDPAFRAWAEEQPLTVLVSALQSEAPAAAARTDMHNPRRVIRALEIARQQQKGVIARPPGRSKQSRGIDITTDGIASLVAQATSSQRQNAYATGNVDVAPHATWNVCKIALAPETDELRTRIEKRAQAMIEHGLLDEVRRLADAYGREAPGLQTIGYRELFSCIDGSCTNEVAAARVSHATWQYARRQLTWLRKEANVTWCKTPEEAEHAVEKFLA